MTFSGARDEGLRGRLSGREGRLCLLTDARSSGIVLRDSSGLESDWSASVPINEDPWKPDTGLQRADGQSALGMTLSW